MYHCSWSVCFRCSSSGLEGEYETDGETIDWTKWRPCCSESSRHLHRRPHWGSSAAYTVHWATAVTPNCSQAAGELHCCKYIQPLCGNMLKMHIQNTLFYWLQFYMHTFFFFTSTERENSSLFLFRVTMHTFLHVFVHLQFIYIYIVLVCLFAHYCLYLWLINVKKYFKNPWPCILFLTTWWSCWVIISVFTDLEAFVS